MVRSKQRHSRIIGIMRRASQSNVGRLRRRIRSLLNSLFTMATILSITLCVWIGILSMSTAARRQQGYDFSAVEKVGYLPRIAETLLTMDIEMQEIQIQMANTKVATDNILLASFVMDSIGLSPTDEDEFKSDCQLVTTTIGELNRSLGLSRDNETTTTPANNEDATVVFNGVSRRYLERKRLESSKQDEEPLEGKRITSPSLQAFTGFNETDILGKRDPCDLSPNPSKRPAEEEPDATEDSSKRSSNDKERLEKELMLTNEREKLGLVRGLTGTKTLKDNAIGLFLTNTQDPLHDFGVEGTFKYGLINLNGVTRSFDVRRIVTSPLRPSFLLYTHGKWKNFFSVVIEKIVRIIRDTGYVNYKIYPYGYAPTPYLRGQPGESEAFNYALNVVFGSNEQIENFSDLFMDLVKKVYPEVRKRWEDYNYELEGSSKTTTTREEHDDGIPKRLTFIEDFFDKPDYKSWSKFYDVPISTPKEKYPKVILSSDMYECSLFFELIQAGLISEAQYYLYTNPLLPLVKRLYVPDTPGDDTWVREMGESIWKKHTVRIMKSEDHIIVEGGSSSYYRNSCGAYLGSLYGLLHPRVTVPKESDRQGERRFVHALAEAKVASAKFATTIISIKTTTGTKTDSATSITSSASDSEKNQKATTHWFRTKYLLQSLFMSSRNLRSTHEEGGQVFSDGIINVPEVKVDLPFRSDYFNTESNKPVKNTEESNKPAKDESNPVDFGSANGIPSSTLLLSEELSDEHFEALKNFDENFLSREVDDKLLISLFYQIKRLMDLERKLTADVKRLRLYIQKYSPLSYNLAVMQDRGFVRRRHRDNSVITYGAPENNKTSYCCLWEEKDTAESYYRERKPASLSSLQKEWEDGFSGELSGEFKLLIGPHLNTLIQTIGRFDWHLTRNVIDEAQKRLSSIQQALIWPRLKLIFQVFAILAFEKRQIRYYKCKFHHIYGEKSKIISSGAVEKERKTIKNRILYARLVQYIIDRLKKEKENVSDVSFVSYYRGPVTHLFLEQEIFENGVEKKSIKKVGSIYPFQFELEWAKLVQEGDNMVKIAKEKDKEAQMGAYVKDEEAYVWELYRDSIAEIHQKAIQIFDQELTHTEGLMDVGGLTDLKNNIDKVVENDLSKGPPAGHVFKTVTKEISDPDDNDSSDRNPSGSKPGAAPLRTSSTLQTATPSLDQKRKRWAYVELFLKHMPDIMQMRKTDAQMKDRSIARVFANLATKLEVMHNDPLNEDPSNLYMEAYTDMHLCENEGDMKHTDTYYTDSFTSTGGSVRNSVTCACAKEMFIEDGKRYAFSKPSSSAGVKVSSPNFERVAADFYTELWQSFDLAVRKGFGGWWSGLIGIGGSTGLNEMKKGLRKRKRWQNQSPDALLKKEIARLKQKNIVSQNIARSTENLPNTERYFESMARRANTDRTPDRTQIRQEEIPDSVPVFDCSTPSNALANVALYLNVGNHTSRSVTTEHIPLDDITCLREFFDEKKPMSDQGSSEKNTTNRERSETKDDLMERRNSDILNRMRLLLELPVAKLLETFFVKLVTTASPEETLRKHHSQAQTRKEEYSDAQRGVKIETAHDTRSAVDIHYPKIPFEDVRAAVNRDTRLQRLHVYFPRLIDNSKVSVINSFLYASNPITGRLVGKHVVLKGFSEADLARAIWRKNATTGLIGGPIDGMLHRYKWKGVKHNPQAKNPFNWFKWDKNYLKSTEGRKLKIPKSIFHPSPVSVSYKLSLNIRMNIPNDWEYFILDDASCMDLFRKAPLLEEFPNAENVFKTQFHRGAHKGDFCVFYYLYIYGGVSIDTDFLLFQNIEDVLQDSDWVVLSQGSKMDKGLIGTKAGNRAIYEALFDMYKTPRKIWEDTQYYLLAMQSLSFRFHQIYKVPLMVHGKNSEKNSAEGNNVVTDNVTVPYYTYSKRGLVSKISLNFKFTFLNEHSREFY